MATITTNINLTFDNGTDDGAATVAVVNDEITPASNVIANHIQSILTTETTINLGPVSSMGYVAFKNLDPTNYIQIKTAASGTIICKLLPGECACWRMGSGVTVPVAIADTATCKLLVLICSA